MNELSRESVFRSISKIISSLKDDWEYSGQITPETSLSKELGIESIEAVLLISMIEEHFKQSFPISEYLIKLDETEFENIKVDDLVDLVYKSLERQYEKAK